MITTPDPTLTVHTLRLNDASSLHLLLPHECMHAPSSSAYYWLAEQLVHANHAIVDLYTYESINAIDAYVHISCVLHHRCLGYRDVIRATATLLHVWVDIAITIDQHGGRHRTDRHHTQKAPRPTPPHPQPNQHPPPPRKST